MAIFEWRKFNFFELKESGGKEAIQLALQDLEIASITAGNQKVIVCDNNGYVYVFSKSWQWYSFKAHDSKISLCEITSHQNFLITVETEKDNVYKIWSFLNDYKTNNPICIRTEKNVVDNATALGVSDKDRLIAIGSAKGTIALFRGDLTRTRSKSIKILPCGMGSVKGISFKSSAEMIHMFICSTSGIYVFNIQSRDIEIKIDLDTSNLSTIHCCALQTGTSGQDGQFMVGKRNAIYCYTPDGRGPCYALDGEKTILQWFRSHLVIVSKQTTPKSSEIKSILTVIDIENKFMAFSSTVEEIAAVLIEFGSCFIITKSKNIFTLDERDLQSKLSLLFKKNLYDIAIHIAQKNQYDSEELATIFQHYGDHLYNKGEYVAAVEQYSKAARFLEPSYVIRRFLDSKHIQYLTEYLQALHVQKLATPEHTTLLINCLIKQHRREKLSEFLEISNNKEPMYSIDITIETCKRTSVDYALLLAKEHKKHNAYIGILIESQGEYQNALNYIKELKLADAINSLKMYGNVLIEQLPLETIELLQTIYIESQTSNAGEKMVGEPKYNIVEILEFMHLYINTSARLITFLEYLITNETITDELIYHTIIEYYLKQWRSGDEIVKNNYNTKIIDFLKLHNKCYDINHVLIQCQTYGFLLGIKHLYEEQNAYNLVVRHHLKYKEYSSLIEACRRMGTQQPTLWLQVLMGIKNDKNAEPKYLTQVLQVIAEEKLQSPLQVLGSLGIENGLDYGSVRDYFTNIFKREIEQTEKDEELKTKYSTSASILKTSIDKLQQLPIEFRKTVCDTCYKSLNMPSLHFLCDHAYHQECVRSYFENETDCPLCHEKDSHLSEAFKIQLHTREQHEIFHNMLDRSIEPFTVVSEYFGRNLFNKIVIVNESDNAKKDKNMIEPAPIPLAYSTSAGELTRKLNETRTQPNLAKKSTNPPNRLIASSSSSSSTSLSKSLARPIQPKNILPTWIQSSVDRFHKIPTPQLSKSYSNPFEVPDDYDTSKNPFEEENDERKESEDTTIYDKNLNPFE